MCVCLCVMKMKTTGTKKIGNRFCFFFCMMLRKTSKKKEEKIAQDEIPKQTKQNKIIESDQRQKETIIIDDCRRRLRGRK